MRRGLLPFWLLGGILVIGLLYGVRWYVRDQAQQSASAATAIAARAEHAATQKALEIGYRNAISACQRGKSVRLSVRANAMAVRDAFTTLNGFFQGARPRAVAQSHDPNIGAVSRAAAGKSVASIDHAIRVFATPISVPPPPPSCTDVIIDPTGPAGPQNP